MTKLEILGKTDKYLFHGSSRKVRRLEPRQQMTYSHKKQKLVKDGKPAVCATPFLKVAMFRSLLSKGFTSFGVTNGRITLRASPEALVFARKAYGFIYVIPKNKFRKHSPIEWRAFRTIDPLTVIQTSHRDLPSGIRVIRDWQKWRRRFYKKHKTAHRAVG